jgi:hypothetical protein
LLSIRHKSPEKVMYYYYSFTDGGCRGEISCDFIRLYISIRKDMYLSIGTEKKRIGTAIALYPLRNSHRVQT